MLPLVSPAQNKLLSLRMLFILAIVLAELLRPTAARAQISFAGAQNTLFAGSAGLSLSPVAVDSNGDAFFVTYNGSANQLMEVPANGTPTVINGNFPSIPTAIAVNSAGTTLYFIYYGSTTNCSGGFVFVAMAPVTTGVPTNLPCSFTLDDGSTPTTVKYTNPNGLAVDPSGNLWIADEGGGDFFEIPSPVTASSVPTTTAGLSVGQPYDIAVNGNGDVYFTLLTFHNSSEVQEVADIPTSSFTNNLGSSPLTASAIVTNVPSIQSGLAINSSGNLYLGGNLVDSEIIGSSLVTVDGDFANGTEGLAVDSNGNLYIAGFDSTDTQYVVELNRKAASFGSQAVGQTSTAKTLSFIITSTTVGSIGVLTMGQANQDFAIATGTTCTARAYASATACLVNVTFAPTAPGLRTGALVFYSGANSTGSVLAQVPLYGVGSGPEVAYYPGTVLSIDPTVNSLQLKYPEAVAVDGAGDLYIADYNNDRVVEVPAGNGTAKAIDPSVNGKTLFGPSGVALDGAGDLFILDAGNERVVEVAIDGTLTAITPQVNSTGLDGPQGIALDGAGDLYIADQYNNRVVELPSGGGTAVAIDPTAGGIPVEYPTAVAVDGAGNLFIADYHNSRVVKVPPGNGTPSSISPSPDSEALDGASGVAVDAAGDLYISDFFNGRVVEVPANGSAAVAIEPVLNGSELLGLPEGLAVDAVGDLFIASSYYWLVAEVQHSAPPTLSFPTPTLVGSTDTTDGPQTVTIYNVGTNVLTLYTPSGSDPLYPPGFPVNSGESNLCANGEYLPPAYACEISADFEPVSAGTNTGDIVLTDNATNQGNGTQSIPLTGVNSQIAQTISFPAPASPVIYGVSPITLVATGGASGNSVVFTVVSGPGSVSGTNGSILSITGAGTVIVAANQAGDTDYAPAAQTTQSIVVNTAPLSVTVNSGTKVYGAALPTFSGTITGLVNGDTLSATYSSTGTASSPAGTYPIAATLSGAALSNYSPTVTPGTLTISKAKLKVTAKNASRPYNTANPTFTNTITGFVNGDTQSVVSGTASLTTTATLSSTVGTYPITAAQGTLSASNYTFNFANGTLTITQAKPTISWAAPAAITYGTALSATQLDASSTVAGIIAYTPASGTVLTAGTQTLSVTLTPTDTTDYTNATAMVSLTVNQATPTIRWTTPAAITYGTALSATQLDASSTVYGSFAYTPASGTVLDGGSQTLSVTLTPNDSIDYATVTKTVSITVEKVAQTITFPAITAQPALTTYTLSATASSGLPVTFTTTTPAICTVSDGATTLLTPGFCAVEATQAGNADYTAAPGVGRNIQVVKASQAITFPSIASQPALTSVTLSATASSSLTVGYTSLTTSVCTVTSGSALLLEHGTCTIQASQAGNTVYSAAANVSESFTVSYATQTITFAAIPEQPALTMYTLSAAASSGLPITFTTTTPSICTISGNVASLLTPGYCAVEATQAGNNDYSAAPGVGRNIEVVKASQAITFPSITTQPALSTVALSATASSSLTVSFTSLTPSVCTVMGDSASLLEHGTCTIQASQSGNTLYAAAANVSESFMVSYLAQTITFPAIAAQPVGTMVTLSATDSSGLPITFSTTTPSVCSISGNTATLSTTGYCAVETSQPGNNVYSAAPAVGRNIHVLPAS
jgi:sugar lactone lactonase YvrE